MFQSTHPHGVRHWISLIIWSIPSCFNPRTHTGCDSPDQGYFRSGRTSVSIHAPTRGATPGMVFTIEPMISFNPRTHTGCDMRGINRYAKAANCFNPRTHTGCDFIVTQALDISRMFQSTHPHGVRRMPCLR